MTSSMAMCALNSQEVLVGLRRDCLLEFSEEIWKFDIHIYVYTCVCPGMIQILGQGKKVTTRSVMDTTNDEIKTRWNRRGISPELAGNQSKDPPGQPWTELEQPVTPQQNNFTNTKETRLACGVYTVLSSLYAVRNWKIDFIQQTHIRQARNWMAAIGHATIEGISLHRCRCGQSYEQWGNRPTPPCPTCEKIRLRKTGPEKRKMENDERTDRTPAASLITPPQAPTPRSGAYTRQDSVLKMAEKKSCQSREPQEPERNAKRSPSPMKFGRGLQNTGNTCFLNATIQCLGAIDEVNQAHSLTNKSTITQDKPMTCIRELQKPGTAYTPAPLIQQIPHLIRYRKGDPADAHELLIALINDISEPISQIFQGQMASTVQCSHCNKTTTKTDNTQDISLHIEADSSTSLEEKLYNFFQPETLEGENAYWCDACQESCRAMKTLSYTHIPTILIVHLKRLILEKKIQNHIPFDTALEMEPYMAPGHALTQKMKLIGIISHQGTKDHGNYVAITNRGNEWTSFNDAITAQTTLTHLHQSQAYILIYRKMEHSAGTEN